MTPLTFSIIIPHSNTTIENDPLLPTLASIADQEGISLELLIQHGGGITGLWGKLSRALNLSSKKEHVTLRIIEEKSPSPLEAIAAGVKRATGTWVGFLQPGEQYLPGALMALQTFLENHPRADLLLTSSLSYTAKQVKLHPVVPPSLSYLTRVQPSYSLHSLFFRTSLLRDEIILDPAHQHQMITECLLHLLRGEKEIHALPVLTTSILPEQEEKAVSSTSSPSLFHFWHTWRQQRAIRAAQKAIMVPAPLFLYHDSLTQRTSMS